MEKKLLQGLGRQICIITAAEKVEKSETVPKINVHYRWLLVSYVFTFWYAMGDDCTSKITDRLPVDASRVLV